MPNFSAAATKGWLSLVGTSAISTESTPAFWQR
ncbi:Uncharacterised protein [Vibrio cholerae]|nr:Uncharacterised protein [Vibrio cholerae]